MQSLPTRSPKMANGLEGRLARLERAYRGVDVWGRAVVEWGQWKRLSPYREWLFLTESVRPGLVWKHLGDPKPMRRKEMEADWRGARERRWISLFWSKRWVATGKDACFESYCAEEDPAVPPPEQSAEDFQLLLTTIPPGAFEWARRFFEEEHRLPEGLRGNRKWMEDLAWRFLVCEAKAVATIRTNGRLTMAEFERVIEERRPELRTERAPRRT